MVKEADIDKAQSLEQLLPDGLCIGDALGVGRLHGDEQVSAVLGPMDDAQIEPHIRL